jgi:hypothetical protein
VKRATASLEHLDDPNARLAVTERYRFAADARHEVTHLDLQRLDLRHSRGVHVAGAVAPAELLDGQALDAAVVDLHSLGVAMQMASIDGSAKSGW